MNNINVKIISLILIPLFLSACATTYTDFPEQMVGNPPEPVIQGVLNYKIKRYSITGTTIEDSLRTIFQNKTPFVKTKEVDEIPDQGIYCFVEVEHKPFSLPALIFFSISAIAYTLLPAWSTEDGYRVTYHIYVDGEEKDAYNYEITRKTGLWFYLLPFAWINLLTYSLEEALEATAYQFFKDASPILSGIER